MRINVKKYGIFCLCTLFFMGCGQNSSSLGMRKHGNKAVDLKKEQRYWRKKHKENPRYWSKSPQRTLIEEPQWELNEELPWILIKEPQRILSKTSKKLFFYTMIMTVPLILQGIPLSNAAVTGENKNSYSVCGDISKDHQKYFSAIAIKKDLDVNTESIYNCDFLSSEFVTSCKKKLQEVRGALAYPRKYRNVEYLQYPINQDRMVLDNKSYLLNNQYKMIGVCKGKSTQYILNWNMELCTGISKKTRKCSNSSVKRGTPQYLFNKICNNPSLRERESEFYETASDIIFNAQDQLEESCNDPKSIAPAISIMNVALQFHIAGNHTREEANHSSALNIYNNEGKRLRKALSQVREDLGNEKRDSPGYVQKLHEQDEIQNQIFTLDRVREREEDHFGMKIFNSIKSYGDILLTSLNETLGAIKENAASLNKTGTETLGAIKENVASLNKTGTETLEAIKENVASLNKTGTETLGAIKETAASFNKTGTETFGAIKKMINETSGSCKEDSGFFKAIVKQCRQKQRITVGTNQNQVLALEEENKKLKEKLEALEELKEELEELNEEVEELNEKVEKLNEELKELEKKRNLFECAGINNMTVSIDEITNE